MKRLCKQLLTRGKIGFSNLLLTFLSLALGTVSCTVETDRAQSRQQLVLDVSTSQLSSRGIIESATLPDGHSIGISLVDATGSTYNGLSYRNVKATASTGVSPQAWTLSSDVFLTETAGTVFGYYPYSSLETDFSAISIETASQTDYMFATPVSVDCDNPDASLIFNHMLSNFRLTVDRGSYTGRGFVSAITVQGNGIATGGVFNATAQTPAYKSLEGTGEPVGGTFDTEPVGVQHDLMVVPVGVSAPVTFRVTVDGTEFTATTAAVKLQPGESYAYTLTLHEDRNLSCTYNGVTAWTESPEHENAIDAGGGHSVYITGDISNLAFNSSVSGDGTVTIIVLPVNSGYIKPVDYESAGTATLVESGNIVSGNLTLALSDIESDVTLSFVESDNIDGYLGYSLNVTGDIQDLVVDKFLSRGGIASVLISGIQEPSSINVSGSASVSKDYDLPTSSWWVRLSDVNSNVDIDVSLHPVDVVYNTDDFSIVRTLTADNSMTVEIVPTDNTLDLSTVEVDVTGAATVEQVLDTENNRLVVKLTGITGALTINVFKIEMIQFTVLGKTYNAVSGMTWAEFCNSEYNIETNGLGLGGDFSYDSYRVYVMTGAGFSMHLKLNDVFVLPTDQIVSGITYSYYNPMNEQQ